MDFDFKFNKVVEDNLTQIEQENKIDHIEHKYRFEQYDKIYNFYKKCLQNFNQQKNHKKLNQ